MSVRSRILEWPTSTCGGLDATDYIAHLERQFAVAIDPAEAESLRTLGNLARLLSQKLTTAGRPAADDAVWDAVRRITSEEFGVREDELKPGVRFVEDLNC
jgi:hypothetical protein